MARDVIIEVDSSDDDDNVTFIQCPDCKSQFRYAFKHDDGREVTLNEHLPGGDKKRNQKINTIRMHYFRAHKNIEPINYPKAIAHKRKVGEADDEYNVRVRKSLKSRILPRERLGKQKRPRYERETFTKEVRFRIGFDRTSLEL
jgi:hypothetical protein